MRILAIGDIHGCTIAFDSLIAAINLRECDRIITLGDYIDRGPDSKGIIDRLLALHHTGRLVALLNLRHAICIDTWVYGQGWLTCLDVTSARIWQANQKGNVQQAWLDEFLLD